MNDDVASQPLTLTLPPVMSPLDDEVDVTILKAIPEQFAIDSNRHANWLIRRITDARKYADRVKEWAELELRRAAREETTLLYIFGNELEHWAREQIATDSRRKSINLPAGVVGFRMLPASIRVTDEQAVMDWARCTCPDAVKTTERLLVSVVIDYVKNTGDFPDTGITQMPEREKFYVR